MIRNNTLLLQATVELSGHLTRGQMLFEKREWKPDVQSYNVTNIEEMDMDVFKRILLRAFSSSN